MKTLINTLAAAIIFIIAIQVSFANETAYKLTVSNLNYTSPNTLEFDIYLLNSNSDKSELNYVLGQYFLEFNPNIANGGKLTYSIVSSVLPEAMRPRNPSVFENVLRLACNLISSSKDNLSVIPKEAPGLLVVRMKLETSADKFSSEPLNLKLTDASSKFRTKIFSFIDNKNVELTNSENNATDILNKNGEGTQKITLLPTEYSLSQNYPNPFNPATKIKFDIPLDARRETKDVRLVVYDITGREVAMLFNKKLSAGSYEVKFDGSNFASGVYFYRIEAGDFMQIRRMVLIK